MSLDVLQRFAPAPVAERPDWSGWRWSSFLRAHGREALLDTPLRQAARAIVSG